MTKQGSGDQALELGIGPTALAGKGAADQPVSKAEGRRRPIGVSVLAVLNILGGVLLGLAAMGAANEAADVDVAGPAAAVLGAMAVGQIVVGTGLWRLRNWARKVAVSLYGLSAVIGILTLFMGSVAGLLQAGIAVSWAVYLSREHVRDAFLGIGS